MTIVEVEKEEYTTETKVVRTCDFCDLSEEEMPDSEDIQNVYINPKLIHSWTTKRSGDVDANTESVPFLAEDGADLSVGSDSVRFRAEVSGEACLDMCDHCIETLFSKGDK